MKHEGQKNKRTGKVKIPVKKKKGEKEAVGQEGNVIKQHSVSK